MYTHIVNGWCPTAEVEHLLAEAHARIETSASFIVPYPFVPDCFADLHILQTKLVGLQPSQQIVAHRDPSIDGRRYHIPLQTNGGCWSLSGRDWTQLVEGLVYLMDPTILHGAVNWGSEVRLHLMIDVGA